MENCNGDIINHIDNLALSEAIIKLNKINEYDFRYSKYYYVKFKRKEIKQLKGLRIIKKYRICRGLHMVLLDVKFSSTDRKIAIYILAKNKPIIYFEMRYDIVYFSNYKRRIFDVTYYKCDDYVTMNAQINIFDKINKWSDKQIRKHDKKEMLKNRKENFIKKVENKKVEKFLKNIEK